MIRYHRDVPLDAAGDVLAATEAHVRAHLSAVADADDNPESNADDVHVRRETIPGECVRIHGELDAEPDAPYLRDDYDPYDGIPADLVAEASR